MSSSLPSFRDYDDPARKSPYGWDYGHGAGRKRITFRTKKDKRDFRDAYRDRWYSQRDAILHFDQAEWSEVQHLKERLGGRTLREAVDYFLQHGKASTEVPMLSEMARSRIADIERMGASVKGHAELYIGRFLAHAGDRRVDQYQREVIQDWADDLAKEHARTTTKNHLKQIQKLFNDAVTEGYISRSPAARIQLPTTRGEKRMTLIDPDDLRRLLNHAWEVDRSMAGLLAILFFTGMRISMIAVPPRKRKGKEFLRLDMIDREHRTIVVPEGIMKSEAALIIDDAPECLWGWLTHLKQKDFAMPQNTFNKRKRALCEAVGVEWPTNLHRRSFGSYLAALRGRDYAANIMGDRTESVFVKHYQVPTFKRLAEQYVAIYAPE